MGNECCGEEGVAPTRRTDSPTTLAHAAVPPPALAPADPLPAQHHHAALDDVEHHRHSPRSLVLQPAVVVPAHEGEEGDEEDASSSEDEHDIDNYRQRQLAQQQSQSQQQQHQQHTNHPDADLQHRVLMLLLQSMHQQQPTSGGGGASPTGNSTEDADARIVRLLYLQEVMAAQHQQLQHLRGGIGGNNNNNTDMFDFFSSQQQHQHPLPSQQHQHQKKREVIAEKDLAQIGRVMPYADWRRMVKNEACWNGASAASSSASAALVAPSAAAENGGGSLLADAAAVTASAATGGTVTMHAVGSPAPELETGARFFSAAENQTGDMDDEEIHLAAVVAGAVTPASSTTSVSRGNNNDDDDDDDDGANSRSNTNTHNKNDACGSSGNDVAALCGQAKNVAPIPGVVLHEVSLLSSSTVVSSTLGDRNENNNKNYKDDESSPNRHGTAAGFHYHQQLLEQQQQQQLSHQQQQSEDEMAECAICLCNLAGDDSREVRVISKCGHVMHRECVDQWLTKRHWSCPLCAQCVWVKK